MLVLVIHEGKVVFKRRGPAAGAVAHFVLAALLPEPRSHHVLHGDVIVVSMRYAFTAAVTQKYRFIALVTEAQFAHGELQLSDGAGLGPPSSLSPSGLALT